jgi:hypothetical protein
MNTHYRLIINPFAELDLHSSFEFYELQKDGLGQEFMTQVDLTIQCIKLNPFQFSQEKQNIRKALVERFPFAVYYFLNDDLINIFAIFHFSRNPKKLRGRILKKT